MFKDITTVKIKAGKGGKGLVSFKSVNAQKRADGGDGGKGGNVYVEGSTNMYDLSFAKKDQVFSAENGDQGGTNNAMGADGADLILKLPLATNIYSNGRLVARVDKAGERKLLLKGGGPGRGNLSFKRGGLDALYQYTPGDDGQEIDAELQLELVSDVIFIGLPNAGKSSILNSLTNADAKVASYAFTTIIPQLGRMGNITLMDLPGLIEKTFEGKGLGTRFVKHTKSAKLVLHFISLENPDLLEAYNTIRTELKNIDERLATLPEVIVLTKSDTIEDKKIIEKSKKIFEKKKLPVTVVSIIDDESLDQLRQLITKQLS